MICHWLDGIFPRPLTQRCEKLQAVMRAAKAGEQCGRTASRPGQFRDRDVIHFIDNAGALAILAKGYSKDEDCGRMTHFYHAIAAALQARVWFEYVCCIRR